jgi:hypothetical protein
MVPKLGAGQAHGDWGDAFGDPVVAIVNTGRKIPKSSVENSPVLQIILKMAALSSGVLRT